MNSDNSTVSVCVFIALMPWLIYRIGNLALFFFWPESFSWVNLLPALVSCVLCTKYAKRRKFEKETQTSPLTGSAVRPPKPLWVNGYSHVFLDEYHSLHSHMKNLRGSGRFLRFLLAHTSQGSMGTVQQGSSSWNVPDWVQLGEKKSLSTQTGGDSRGRSKMELFLVSFWSKEKTPNTGMKHADKNSL